MRTLLMRVLLPTILSLTLLSTYSVGTAAQTQGTVESAYNPLVYSRLDVTVRLTRDGRATVDMRITIRNEGKVLVVPGYGRVPLNLRGENSTVEILRSVDLNTGRKIEAVVLDVNGTKIVSCLLYTSPSPRD